MAVIRGSSTGTYRGIDFLSSGGGTGGNQIMNASTGTLKEPVSNTGWHPTVLYLIALLVVEWAAFIVLNKYL